MLPTLATPVSERAPTEESLTIWAQREVIPFMLGVRRALNLEYSSALAYNSAGAGTVDTVWTSGSIPTDRAISIRIDAVALSASGPAQAATYSLRGLIYNLSGTVAQAGTTAATFTETTDAAIVIALAVLGQEAVITVQDNGVSPMAWKLHVSMVFTEEQ